MVHLLSQKKLSEDELHFLRRHMDFSIDYYKPFEVIYPPLTLDINPEEDILIFTSQHAVESISSHFTHDPGRYTCICIEGKTRELAEKKGFDVLFSARSAEDLTTLIRHHNIQKRYIYTCSNDRLDTLNIFFNTNTKFKFIEVVVYEKKMLFPKVSDHPDILLAFSPSGIVALEPSGLNKSRILVICIGKTTQKKAIELGYNMSLASEKPDTLSMLQLLIQSQRFLKEIQ